MANRRKYIPNAEYKIRLACYKKDPKDPHKYIFKHYKYYIIQYHHKGVVLTKFQSLLYNLNRIDDNSTMTDDELFELIKNVKKPKKIETEIVKDNIKYKHVEYGLPDELKGKLPFHDYYSYFGGRYNDSEEGEKTPTRHSKWFDKNKSPCGFEHKLHEHYCACSQGCRGGDVCLHENCYIFNERNFILLTIGNECIEKFEKGKQCLVCNDRFKFCRDEYCTECKRTGAHRGDFDMHLIERFKNTDYRIGMIEDACEFKPTRHPRTQAFYERIRMGWDIKYV